MLRKRRARQPQRARHQRVVERALLAQPLEHRCRTSSSVRPLNSLFR